LSRNEKDPDVTERVICTEAARALIETLASRHGALVFHQSGGCCDGSAPMCFPAGDFRTGQADVLIGRIAGQPFYIARDQLALWQHTQLIIDVVPGRGASFSLEIPEGVRFISRGRVFTAEELAEVRAATPPAAARD
jgi:uncharacterized protein (DUF779 family)